MNICIGIPTPQFVHPDFALGNLPQIIAHAKETHPDIKVFISYRGGVMTSSNRNSTLKHCLENNIDAILWLDTDMIYPPDILTRMIEANKDIVGSIYFKRTEPYDPVVYVKGDNPARPYRLANVKKLPENTLVEVDGLGFGGLFVKMNVYKAMGSDKWMRYGRNFGIPEEMEDQLSHDLVFCQTAQKYGFKLYVHTAIKCGHIGETLVTEDFWTDEVVTEKKATIAVIIPTIDKTKAEKTISQLKSIAGIDADYYIVEDTERTGYTATINDAVSNIDAEYYVYTAEDAYSGQDWLKKAYDTITKEKKGLLAFNDGKWSGTLASFGMVSRSWMVKNYDGDLFYKGYSSHYGDTELTLIALSENQLVYNPDAVLLEVDYEKHGVNPQDKKLFNERKKLLFDPKFQEIFA